MMPEILEHPTVDQRMDCYRVYRRALRRGELVRATTCAWCGTEAKRIAGHHPDYARPLMVVWICTHCHNAHHFEWTNARQMFRGA